MASKNRVIWTDGLSVNPQHFQQQQRHFDYLVTSKFQAIGGYHYGFSKLTLDLESLKLGRIALKEASGVMPDGTLFELPYQDSVPPLLEIKQITSSASRDIYLALPIVSDSVSELDIARELQTDIVRYKKKQHPVRDLHTKGGGYIGIDLAQLSPKLLQGSEDSSAYTTLRVCRIKELRAGGHLELDPDFIPTVSDINISIRLSLVLKEVESLVRERAEQLALKIGSPTQQGVTGIAEFLMLQLMNASIPYYRHLTRTKVVHPESFYLQLANTCCELMTFTTESRQVPEIARYDHDDLTTTFDDLILKTREALSIVLTPRAVAIPLTLNNGIRTGTIHDQELLTTANFVLAVKSGIPQEQLNRLFIQQTKISSPAQLQQLVHVQLPGIPLKSLSAAPPQLPFHAGYTYFQLDTQVAEWQEIVKTSSIAFHVAGSFPGLDMQLWAVRSK